MDTGVTSWERPPGPKPKNIRGLTKIHAGDTTALERDVRSLEEDKVQLALDLKKEKEKGAAASQKWEVLGACGTVLCRCVCVVLRALSGPVYVRNFSRLTHMTMGEQISACTVGDNQNPPDPNPLPQAEKADLQKQIRMGGSARRDSMKDERKFAKDREVGLVVMAKG